jgi:hypothetical protein
MAKTSPKTTSTPPETKTSSKSPREREGSGVSGIEIEEGAPVKAMTMVKVKGGYVVVELQIEDWQVVDAEILTEGVVPRHHAEDCYRVESYARIMHPEWDPEERN